MVRKILALVLGSSLLFQQVGFAQLAELNMLSFLPSSGSSPVQQRFRPAQLRYFLYDPATDNYRLLLDSGSPKGMDVLKAQEHAKILLNYFLVGLTLSESSFWVNLRPDSPDNAIDGYLVKTDVGKIMLEADLQLKKDTSLFTSPKTPEGKEYWDKLYKKAEELYGNAPATIPTLTRPWIVPGEIIVRESKDSAYIYKAVLDVKLEQDYLKDSSGYSFPDERSKALNEYSSQLIRQRIVPKLVKEVNSGKNYAALRQVYYALILARWFKSRFAGQPGTYSALIDSRNLSGLVSLVSWSKNDYFTQYRRSFTNGEYNTSERIITPSGQSIRRCFSGGISMEMRTNGFAAAGDIPNVLQTQPGIVALEGNASLSFLKPAEVGTSLGGRGQLMPGSIGVRQQDGGSIRSIVDQESEYAKLPVNRRQEVEFGLVRENEVVHKRTLTVPVDGDISSVVDYIVLQISGTLSRIGAEGLVIKASNELYSEVEAKLMRGEYSRVPSYFATIYETVFKMKRTDDPVVVTKELVNVMGAPVVDYRKGRIVGIDVGASDVKVVAFLDGTVIYGKEINWISDGFKKYENHLEYFVLMAKIAKVAIELSLSDVPQKADLTGELHKLGHNANSTLNDIERFIEKVYAAGVDKIRLDGIGLSTAGAVVDGRITQEGAKVYKGIKAEDFWMKTSGIARGISEAMGGVPVGAMNDGDAAALSVAGLLRLNNVLALSLGTGLAAGYVDGRGEVTTFLGEMGKCCIDLAGKDNMHEGLKIPGALQQYTSQRGVLRLARQIWPNFDRDFEEGVAREYAQKNSIDLVSRKDIVGYVSSRLDSETQKAFVKATGNRPKLKYVQAKLGSVDAQEKAQAETIFRQIGHYLSVAVVSSMADLDIKHVVLFGAVPAGRAGELIKETADKDLAARRVIGVEIVLASEEDYAREFGPEISAEFEGEFAARMGQAVGAVYMGIQKANNPEIAKAEPLSDERITQNFTGTGEYGVHIQRTRLARGLADPSKYHDAVVVLVKEDSLDYTVKSMEAAKGVVIPVKSNIVVVREGQTDATAVISRAMSQRRTAKDVVVILSVVPDDVEGSLSAIQRSMRHLVRGGVDFDMERVVMILAGGDGKRNYPVTPGEGYGNKGLVSSLNGQPNIWQAIKQSFQIMGEGDKGMITLATDRIFSISQPIKDLGRQDIQMIGSEIATDHSEWGYNGKVEVAENGSLLALFKRDSQEEHAFLSRDLRRKYYPVNNLTMYYYSAKAIRRLGSEEAIPDGPDISRKDMDLQQTLGKGSAVLSRAGLPVGYISTGNATVTTDLGENSRYYKGYQELFTNAVLRQVVGYSFMAEKAIIDPAAVLGKNVVVEPGAAVIGKVKIDRGVIKKGAFVVNTQVGELVADTGSLVTAVYAPGERIVARANMVVTDVPIEVDDIKRNLRVAVDVNVNPKNTWNDKQFYGQAYKVEDGRILKIVGDITMHSYADMKNFLDTEEVARRQRDGGNAAIPALEMLIENEDAFSWGVAMPADIEELVVLGETVSVASTRDGGRHSPEKVGGIDFRVLQMNIQPIGSFSGLNLGLSSLSESDLARINVDMEIKKLRNMVKAGFEPSAPHVRELVTALIQKREPRAGELLLCIADICKMEEENAVQSAPELKESLAIIDSQG